MEPKPLARRMFLRNGTARLTCREAPRLVRPILQRFGQRAHGDALFAGKISDRPRYPQGAVHGAGGEATPVHGIGDQASAGSVEVAGV